MSPGCTPFIDFHVHLFPDPLYRAIWRWFDRHGWHARLRYSADRVLAYLERAGAKKVVALNYAHRPGMAARLNRWTSEIARAHPFVVPFGTVHPEDRDPQSILKEAFCTHRFKGIKLHCHVMATRPNSPKMYRIYEAATEHGGIILIHAGDGPPLRGYEKATREVSGARFMRQALRKFPQGRFVVPHLGATEVDRFLDLMEEYPNLWMDTTMMFSGWFPIEVPWERLVKVHRRIVYGSDFPNIPYPYSRERSNLMKADIPRTIREAILFKNAARLLGASP